LVFLPANCRYRSIDFLAAPPGQLGHLKLVTATKEVALIGITLNLKSLLSDTMTARSVPERDCICQTASRKRRRFQ
jgi:hypothetical protein